MNDYLEIVKSCNFQMLKAFLKHVDSVAQGRCDVWTLISREISNEKNWRLIACGWMKFDLKLWKRRALNYEIGENMHNFQMNAVEVFIFLYVHFFRL